MPSVNPPNQCKDVFNPCGALPYPLPNITPLVFATGSPVAQYTLTSATPNGGSGGSGGGGTGTATPFQSVTPSIFTDQSTKVAELNSQLGSYGGSIRTLAAFGTPQISLNGTPQDISAVVGDVGANVGLFWGYVKGLAAIGTGSRLMSMLFFLLLLIVLIFLVYILCLIIPIVIRLIRALK